MKDAMKLDLQNHEEIIRNMQKEVNLMASGIDKALKLVGLDGETVVMLSAPVDTGRLKNSITHQVAKDFTVIGTNVEYAIKLEYAGRHKGWFLRAYNQIVPRAKQIFAKEVKR